jgi:hypothetical protein
VLQRLLELKNKVVELRLQCEGFRKLGLEGHRVKQLCNGCGNSIESGQEVVTKYSDGTVGTYYHQECFEHLWDVGRHRTTLRKRIVNRKSKRYRRLARAHTGT